MKVFKFGGASVKDADAVRNIAVILKKYTDDLVVVISAMGKTTNAFERVLNAWLLDDRKTAGNELLYIRDYHMQIAGTLVENKSHPLFDELCSIFAGIEEKLKGNPSESYNEEYDQLVSLGEILSTVIVSNYLNEEGLKNEWTDARQFLKTDSTFREGRVDWNISNKLIKRRFTFNDIKRYVTQGFIGSTVNNLTTTLGREGSDYTAAIIAHVMAAESVTVWKDVPGVLNADPKWFDDTVRLEKISYLDAIELAYYGTSVIHPKTIQPLKNKSIPLYVKSFLHPEDPGTVIGQNDYEKLIPSFIFKMDQVLIHIHPADLSFIAEDNLEKIFRCFAGYGLRINLMQNSAVSFDVCVNNDLSRLPLVLSDLEKDFRVTSTSGLELVTIRYYDDDTIKRVLVNKDLLLTQKTRKTIQMVVRDLG
ncbi:MAG TPA: aspartate kinase [Bacteroidales bacterium]|jgi:aspartate kinase|nr:aspartate kinase [Bacteroidales bacterium]